MSISASTAAPMIEAPARAAQAAQSVPTGEQRDGHGRHIALTFESTLVLPLMPPEDCWCVAIGARGLSAVEGPLPGSVAQQIIHKAQGAVLVVRAPATPEEKMAC